MKQEHNGGILQYPFLRPPGATAEDQEALFRQGPFLYRRFRLCPRLVFPRDWRGHLRRDSRAPVNRVHDRRVWPQQARSVHASASATPLQLLILYSFFFTVSRQRAVYHGRTGV